MTSNKSYKSKLYIRYYDKDQDAWIDKRVYLYHANKHRDIELIDIGIKKAIEMEIIPDWSVVTRIGVIYSNRKLNKSEDKDDIWFTERNRKW